MKEEEGVDQESRCLPNREMEMAYRTAFCLCPMRIVGGNSATQRVAIQSERQDDENCSSLRQKELRVYFLFGKGRKRANTLQKKGEGIRESNDAATVESLAIGVETRAEINP